MLASNRLPAASLAHGRVAFLLPGVPVNLTTKRPDVIADEGDSLGAHLRRRRRERKWRLIDAAAEIGCDPKSLMWWERDAKVPFVHFWPAIISYLGYEPWPEPLTLGEKLKAERRRRGLSTDGSAIAIGVDPGTFIRWESGEWKPQSRSLPMNEAFLAAQLSAASIDQALGLPQVARKQVRQLQVL